ncbi:hypothetical protein KW791_03995 [Candidatus Parcubacteria bacterium]|nr:hypothetical protein [Candidatus Parcubacteria bacterium]
MKKAIKILSYFFIILLAVAAVLFFSIRNMLLEGASCGGIFNGQDERTSEIPKELQNTKLTFKDTAKYSTSTSDYCTPIMNKTNLRITESTYSGDGSSFAKGETFTVQTAYMFRQVGLGSVDAGDSWNPYYLVKDSKGQLYRIYTPTFRDLLITTAIKK